MKIVNDKVSQCEYFTSSKSASILADFYSEAFSMDNINHPEHYTSSEAKCTQCESTIECIDVVRHLSFSLGNAMKYIWRCNFKKNPIQDLKKAVWYLQDEIKRREREFLWNHFAEANKKAGR